MVRLCVLAHSPNTGAERTANNTPINVHKAYNFTTLAAGTDDLGAPTSEVITLRVNNRTIESSCRWATVCWWFSYCYTD